MKIKSIDEYINLCNEANITPNFENFAPSLNESAEINAVTEEVFNAYTKYKSNNIVTLNEYATIKTFEEFVAELDGEEEVAAEEPTADADEVTGDTDELEGDDVDSGDDAGEVGGEETAPEEVEPEAGEEEEAEVEEAPEGEADAAEEVEAEEVEAGEPEDKGEEASDELEDTADNDDDGDDDGDDDDDDDDDDDVEESKTEDIEKEEVKMGEPSEADDDDVEKDDLKESKGLTAKQKGLPESLKRAILKKAGMTTEEIDAELAKMNEESDPVDNADQDIKKADTEDPEAASDDVAKHDDVTAPKAAEGDKGSAGDTGDETKSGASAKSIEDKDVKEGEPKSHTDNEDLQGNDVTNEAEVTLPNGRVVKKKS